MRKRQIQVVTAVLLAAALGVSGCGGSAEKTQGDSAANPAPAAQTAADSGNNAALDALLNGGNLQEAASAAESAGAESAGTESKTEQAGADAGAETAAGAENTAGGAAGSEDAGETGTGGQTGAAGGQNKNEYQKPELALETNYDYIMSDDFEQVLGDYYATRVVLTRRSLEQFPELAKGLDSGIQGDAEKDREEALKELQGAQEAYQFNKEMGEPYEWQWFIKDQRYVHRADEDVVSFLMEGSYWTGGVHPNSYTKGVTLDTRTGKSLDLTDVVSDMEKFKELIVKKLEESYDSDSFFGTPEEQIRENYEDLNMLNWMLEPQGILVKFDPYEIGPYSSGGFQVMVLFSEAPEIFQKKYGASKGGYGIQMTPSEELLADLGNDGTVDHVSVLGQQDYDENWNDTGFYKAWVVSVNGQEITEETMVTGFNPFLVTGADGKNWLWIQAEDLEKYSTWIYDLNGEAPKLVKQMPGTQFTFQESIAQGEFAKRSAEAEARNEFIFSESIDDFRNYRTCFTDPDHFLIGESPDWLWDLNVSGIVKEAKVGADGLPKTEDGYYMITEDFSDVEKVGKDVPLKGTLVDPDTFAEKGEFTVPAGAMIETYATNGKDDIIYRVYDGSSKKFVKFTVDGIGTEEISLNGVRKDDAFDYDIFDYDEAEKDYENDGIRVHLEASEEDTFAPDDSSFLIFALMNMKPEISAMDSSAAVSTEKLDKAVEEEYERFYKGSEKLKSVKECIEEAERQYKDQKDSFYDGDYPLSVDRRTRVGWADRNIVSLLYSWTYDLHTQLYTHFAAQNLDPATGEVITLKDLAADDPAKLKEKLVEQAEWLSKQEAYQDVEPSLMIDWKERLAECIDNGQWFLEDHGITVYANEDEICPGTAGPQFFLVSFEELKDLLKEEYLRK